MTIKTHTHKRPLYHTETGEPVFKTPEDGTCNFCGEWIADDTVEHDGIEYAVCVGCDRLYEIKEVRE